MSDKRRGKGAGYVFDGHFFPTKAAVVSAIQSILNSQPIGEPLAPAHLQFMLAVLEHHPSAVIKIGYGIARIEVRLNERFSNNRNFWIVRHDGTSTDFSFMECLRPSTQMQKVQRAFREAISDQLAEFKLQWFRTQANSAGFVMCPILKAPIAWDDAHVDHQRPLTLVALVEEFIGRKLLSAGDINLLGRQDGMTGNHIEDPDLVREWAVYHRDRAILRVVSRQANLGILRRVDFME